MTDHFAEAESYLQKLDTLESADAYVAVVAAQAHAQLAQLGPAREMVDLQRRLLESMLPAVPTKEEQVKAAVQEAQALARAMPGPEEPAVDEPEGFGSVVRASIHGAVYLWQRSPMQGRHYWESETGAVEVWSALTDVEVLRVGLGEPELANAEAGGYAKGHLDGARGMNDNIHHLLQRLLADAITGERKNAFEKAIQAVEELAP